MAWASESEAAGFASLSVIDRIVYQNYDPLVALTAAAAVTETVRLNTAVLLGPIRQTALLAKSAASLDRLSNGRFQFGLGVGNRPDDYAAGGGDFHHRGRIADAQVEEMLRIWNGEVRGPAGAIGPHPHTPNGPPLLFGGTSPATWQRIARHGQGWMCGVGGPEVFARQSVELQHAWEAAGRPATPRRMMLRYFSFGPNAASDADAFINSAYALAPFRDDLIASMPKSADQLGQLIDAYEAVGCDELMLFPCSSALDQVALLADAVAGRLRLTA